MTGKCPHCGRPYKVQDGAIGKRARCDQCKQVFTVYPPPPPPGEERDPNVASRRDPSMEAERISRDDIYAVARRHNRIVIGAGFVLVTLTFFTGLGLGLNIHPPDQHEYEKGAKAGAELGYTEGFASGRAEGHDDGILMGKSIGAREASERMKAELMPRLTLAIESQDELTQAIRENQEKHKQAIRRTREEAYRQGEEDALVKAKVDEASALASLHKQFASDLAEAKKESYESGLHEAGYQKWYNDGLAKGVDKGRADAEISCNDRVAEERDVARENGLKEGERSGYKKGVAAGKEEGRRLGRKEGDRVGYDRGYQVGYKDGYRIAGGGNP